MKHANLVNKLTMTHIVSNIPEVRDNPTTRSIAIYSHFPLMYEHHLSHTSRLLVFILHLMVNYTSSLEWLKVAYWLENGLMVSLYGFGRTSWANFWDWIRSKCYIFTWYQSQIHPRLDFRSMPQSGLGVKGWLTYWMETQVLSWFMILDRDIFDKYHSYIYPNLITIKP